MYPEFQMCTKVSSREITFKQYIKTLPYWQQKLTSKFTENTVVDPLLDFIQLKQPIIITSDGRKSKNKSRGAWIISDSKGITIIEGTRQDFGCIITIHSCRAEIYGVLSVFIFLKAYCAYYMIQSDSETT